MRAVVYVVENSENAFLAFENLPPYAEYTLRIKDSNGGLTDVQTFSSTGRLSGMKIAFNQVASELKGATLEIVGERGIVALVAQL
jgi:hypothetical protein